MSPFTDNKHRDDWVAFLKEQSLRRYQSGTVILLKNQKPEFVHIIKSGMTKTYDIGLDNEVRPISYDGPGELFPIGWAFHKFPKTKYYYEALTDCEIYQIPRSSYLRYLQENPRITYDMHVRLAENLTSYQARIYALQQSKASDKIIQTLLYMTDKFGRQVDKKTMQIELPLTQQEIAHFIGLTRETVGSELKKLEQQGTIKLRNKSYLINCEKLQALV